MTTAQAMVFTAPQQPLEWREIELPRLLEGEALVRVECCTLCGSDLHSFHGRRKVPMPTILGHEIIGRIETIVGALNDANGAELKPGDRVTWSVAASCGHCFYCTRTLPQKCDKLRKYGHEMLDAHSGLVGGLSTHCHLIPGTSIYRLPESMPATIAAPASCATATVAAVIRTAGDLAGKNVLIFGAGMLGLTAAAMAREAGASAVIVSDPVSSRAARAREFGATLAGPLDDLLIPLFSLVGGRGVDVVLELSGANVAVEAGLGQLRIGGVAIWAGSVFPGGSIIIEPERIVRQMLRIEGVHNYRPEDLGTALAFLQTAGERYPFASLVEATFPLREAEEAFRYATESRPVRVAVVPGVVMGTGDAS